MTRSLITITDRESLTSILESLIRGSNDQWIHGSEILD